MIIKKAPVALVNSALAWCPELPHLKNAVVAGGFIRAYYAGEDPSDMDLYFRGLADLDSARDYLTAEVDVPTRNEPGLVVNARPWEIVASTDRAITLRSTQTRRIVQLVKAITGAPESLIEQFDFTICAAALTINPPEVEEQSPSGLVYLHDDFFEHLAGRILIFNRSPMPLASLKRMVKYLKRGYNICDENLIRLAEAIAKAVDFGNPESVQANIEGMDPNGERRIRAID